MPSLSLSLNLTNWVRKCRQLLTLLFEFFFENLFPTEKCIRSANKLVLPRQLLSLSLSLPLGGIAGLKKQLQVPLCSTWIQKCTHSYTHTYNLHTYVCICVCVGSGIAGGDCHSRRLLMAAIARRKFSNRISTENLQLSKIYSLLRGVVYVTMQWGLWCCTRSGTEIEMSSLASE